MLCGSAPLPAWSGKTQRHRLNRGGDRAVNSALHMAAICRPQARPAPPGIRRPPPTRRPHQTRNPALPQALHRPRGLPPPHLTNMRASPAANTPRSTTPRSSPTIACFGRSGPAATPTTTRSRRASSRRSRRTSSIAAPGPPGRSRTAVFDYIECFYDPSGCTRRSATCRRSSTSSATAPPRIVPASVTQEELPLAA
jgi:hypothetical protein